MKIERVENHQIDLTTTFEPVNLRNRFELSGIRLIATLRENSKWGFTERLRLQTLKPDGKVDRRYNREWRFCDFIGIDSVCCWLLTVKAKETELANAMRDYAMLMIREEAKTIRPETADKRAAELFDSLVAEITSLLPELAQEETTS